MYEVSLSSMILLVFILAIIFSLRVGLGTILSLKSSTDTVVSMTGVQKVVESINNVVSPIMYYFSDSPISQSSYIDVYLGGGTYALKLPGSSDKIVKLMYISTSGQKVYSTIIPKEYEYRGKPVYVILNGQNLSKINSDTKIIPLIKLNKEHEVSVTTVATTETHYTKDKNNKQKVCCYVLKIQVSVSTTS